MKKNINIVALIFSFIVLYADCLFAQDRAVVNTSLSKYAKLSGLDMTAITWTNGFWADRFKVCRETMIPNLWRIYSDPKMGHAIQNFEIAAGLDTGSHGGAPFQDGDFYKLFEAAAAVYAATHDPKIDRMMDQTIVLFAKAQRADGYINTQTLIDERNRPKEAKAFEDRMNFETYNFGHLMTAACVHYRATGKRSFLNIAIKATDYLYHFYKTASPELARNAICPSHYMGVVEMYRTTKNPRYLELVENLINIRGLMKNGEDQNQDRIPFREQTKAMGHAVRANYLYAGAADIYAETGDTTLLHALNLIWNDVVGHKLYITGGCGALYDGVSPDGISYQPKDIQQVAQAYGREYQLPNFTAHNETCASIGNVLWNWRMLQITGDAKYADVLEQTLYNGVLSGISLDGKNFFYTNPLSANDDLPYKLRWSRDRVGYIAYSDCCPPNAVRTIAEVSSYAYNISDKGIWFNLYGGNKLSTTLKDGTPVKLTQTTSYPWDGTVNIQIENTPGKEFSIFLRIPGWCNGASLLVNGKPADVKIIPATYAELKGRWKSGDKLTLLLPMPVKFIEANPLVEEARNQVAVKRGPIVYCLESVDLPTDRKIFDIALSAKTVLKPAPIKIENSDIMSLTGEADMRNEDGWKNSLYREVSTKNNGSARIRLIPYYAWDNRGHNDMETWIPFDR